LMDAELTAHVATPGLEHLTGVAVLTYTETQVNNSLGNRPLMSALPVSRFGELSYLPVGVSGDFQGATMNFESRWYPGIIENDGTYVFLRNGTTGSVEGVYYAYMKNAINASSMVAPTRTNYRYQPAYFPTGTTARWVTKSDGNCILGRLQSAAGVVGDYFVSLTNGTFDSTQHVGGVIPAANFPARVDASCNVEAIVGNANVYIIVTSSSFTDATVTPVEFQIWSIPIATLQAANGGNVVPTQLTGWNTTGFGGTAYNGTTNVRVAACQVNTSGTAGAMATVPASPSLPTNLFVDNSGDINTDSAQDPATGNIRIRVSGLSFLTVPSSGYSLNQYVAFWININPTAKTAALEGPATTPATLTYNSANGTAAYSGSLFNTNPSSIIPQPYQGGQGTPTWTAAGYWFSIVDSDPPDYGSNIARAQCAAKYANRYIALAPASTVSGNTTVGFNPAYGTPLGGRMTGSWLLPGGYMMASSYGPRADGVTMEWGPVVCQPGASGYSYNSQYNGTMTGLAPSTFRKRISDMGLSVDNYTCMMSEVAAGGAVTASTGRFLEGYNTTGYASVTVAGGVLVPSGAVSMTAAVLQTVKTAIWAALGIAAPPASSLEVFIPQNTAIPPFALMTYTDASKNLWVSMVELSITSGARTGAINSMGVVSFSTPLQTDTGSTILAPSTAAIWTTGACFINEGTDAWFVGCTAKTYISIPGTGGGHVFRFAIPKSTNRPQWSTLFIGVAGITYNAPFFMGYPGLGFGECDQNPTSSDNYTKITLTVRATSTLAQFNAWTAGTTYVLVSQDVVQGWVVYFNAVAPLIFNGKSTTLPVMSIDLTTIQANPASSTFYVYIQLVGGVPTYVISATEVAESLTNMFVGLIDTNTTSIASIAMNKVTRIGTYRVSSTSAGSAIPSTTGLPSRTAHLPWS
ncbi:MAG: hypothetical protein P4L77_11925, partial [Sulfuriferula sp.]|nr:hypothetical protein [Sulfuriferula sp.]